MTTSLISKDDCIGFFMETSFHYEVYRNIIAELVKQKVRCELIINNLIEPEFVNEMLASLAKISVSGLDCMFLSAALNMSKKYSCLLSPYYLDYFDKLSSVHIRTIYGLAKNQWNHAEWNAKYNAILCYSNYTKKSLSPDDNVHIVGNPRFDDWHNSLYNPALPNELKIQAPKPTILYAPTYGELSSLIPWAEKLGRLSHEYNIITKLHHGTLYKKGELSALKAARRHLKNLVSSSDVTFSLLNQADYVITDNSGFIFDAINADKKVILLNWQEMDTLLKDNQTLSSLDSPEQQVRAFLPVAHDMAELRQYLSAEYDWQQHAGKLREIKMEYCDAFNDGMAGQRAAQVIINTITQ
jgi:hypothetical protein